MAIDKKFPSDAADKFLLRLPNGMREQISEAAKAAGRSMNAEIISRLQLTFETPEVPASMRTAGDKERRLLGRRNQLDQQLKVLASRRDFLHDQMLQIDEKDEDAPSRTAAIRTEIHKVWEARGPIEQEIDDLDHELRSVAGDAEEAPGGMSGRDYVVTIKKL